MERIRNLDRYQKGVLVFMAAMLLVFTPLYPATIARKGFLYEDAILVPREEDGGTVYSGKIQGEDAVFTVDGDGTVGFRYGDRSYGPYTVREDPSAIPEDTGLEEGMTGIELRRGEEVIFRGGVLDGWDGFWLYQEDGSPYVSVTAAMGDGTVIDENGNEIDPMEPSVGTILSLMAGPELEHKGDWYGWLYGALLCAVTAVSILFADELFRWNLSFQIRDVDRAEPSDWEIAGRYIAWTVMPLVALVVFIVGLQ